VRSSTGVTSSEGRRQHFAPFQLRGIVRSSKGDVVHTARAHPAIGELGLNQHIDVIAQRIALSGKAKAGPVLADLVEAHGGQHATVLS
jgi:hypothetical protein